MITLPPSLLRLANRIAQGAVSCHVARTQRERDAIARLRYEVHIDEQNVGVPEADHERKRIWYADDDQPGTLHFYAGTVDNMLGCLRVRVWAPGEVPADVRDFYSMDSLPGVERLTVCDVSKMIVTRKLRGTAAMSALSGFSIYETVSRYQNALMFACCAPGLLRAYRAIGLRTFGGRMRHTAWGLVIPLIGLTNDVEHTWRIGSPWYEALRRLRSEGRLPAELPEFRRQAVLDRSAITDAVQVTGELREFAADGRSAFFNKLPLRIVELMGRYAMILDVPAGVRLCREGVAEREVFVVLRGEFEVSRDDRALSRLGVGEIFGEMALLSESGRRSADVRSLVPGRVLVLRRRFLRAIAADNPGAAFAVSEALVQELLRKLSAPPLPSVVRPVGQMFES